MTPVALITRRGDDAKIRAKRARAACLEVGGGLHGVTHGGGFEVGGFFELRAQLIGFLPERIHGRGTTVLALERSNRVPQQELFDGRNDSRPCHV